MQTPISASRNPSSAPRNEAPDDGNSPSLPPSEEGHLSETVALNHWLRLLVVVATFLLLLLTVGVVVRLLAFIGHTLLLFSLGGLFAYALDPLVERIRRGANGRSRPRWFGVLVVFTSLFLLIVLGSALLGSDLAREVTYLQTNRAKLEEKGMTRLASLDEWFALHGIHVSLEDTVVHPPPQIRSWSQAAAENTLTTAGRFSKSLVEGAVVLLIALYFLIYSEEMREGARRGLPSRLQPYVAQWQSDVNRILGGFVRGQMLLALILGAAAAVGCLLLGVHFWLLIGIFVVFASLIPVFGPYVGAVPAVISAFLSAPGSLLNPITRVVLVLLLFVVLNEVGSKILYPRLVGGALGLHEVLVLFVLFAGLEVGGLWGVLFAAPLTALVSVTLVQLYRFWEGKPPYSVAQAAKEGGAEAEAHGAP